MVRRSSSIDVFVIGVNGPRTPALLTSTCSAPSSAADRGLPRRLVADVEVDVAGGVADLLGGDRRPRRRARRPSTTLAPSAANRRASSAPCPRAAPVMRTVLPSNLTACRRRRATWRRTASRRRRRGRAASRAPSTWCSPAWPRTCMAASPKRIIPEAPIGFVDSTPPLMLTGRSPSSCGGAVLGHPPALPGVGEEQVLHPHRLEPGERHVDLGAVDLAAWVGDAGLPVDVLGAQRAAEGQHRVAVGGHRRLRAHGRAVEPRRLAALGGRLVAHLLRSEHEGEGAVGGRAGLLVADRVPQHHRVLDRVEGHLVLVQVGVRVLRARSSRSLSATRIPMWSGAFDRRMYDADVRGEVAAGAGVQRRLERDRHRQRPHGVRLGLLLEGDRQHPLVDAGGDEL